MRSLGKLDQIGFYTLSDARARNASSTSPLWRAELILTDRCSFRCRYCRGLRSDLIGDLPFDQAAETLKLWIAEGLKNVRFSGGEPTLYPRLLDLVAICKRGGVERIAISTNGASSPNLYKRLIRAGVSDVSVSLDACCSAIGDTMAGVDGSWAKVVSNIKLLSGLTYVTVGMVFTETNVGQCVDSVIYASKLGVADIRVIPSAQYNQALAELAKLPQSILSRYPILNYRVQNTKEQRHVRGIRRQDSDRCSLVLDDVAAAGGKHFPCVIYMREYGDPIGAINLNMRKDRYNWFTHCNPKEDPICSSNCLDVCVDYNNVYAALHEDINVNC